MPHEHSISVNKCVLDRDRYDSAIQLLAYLLELHVIVAQKIASLNAVKLRPTASPAALQKIPFGALGLAQGGDGASSRTLLSAQVQPALSEWPGAHGACGTFGFWLLTTGCASHEAHLGGKTLGQLGQSPPRLLQDL